jgi:hypothetical protein
MSLSQNFLLKEYFSLKHMRSTVVIVHIVVDHLFIPNKLTDLTVAKSATG